MITWFKDDRQHDFTIYDGKEGIIKFVIMPHRDKFVLYSGYGEKVTQEVIKKYCSSVSSWCIQDIDKLWAEGYYFKKLTAYKTSDNVDELKRLAETVIRKLD